MLERSSIKCCKIRILRDFYPFRPEVCKGGRGHLDFEKFGYLQQAVYIVSLQVGMIADCAGKGAAVRVRFPENILKTLMTNLFFSDFFHGTFGDAVLNRFVGLLLEYILQEKK